MRDITYLIFQANGNVVVRAGRHRLIVSRCHDCIFCPGITCDPCGGNICPQALEGGPTAFVRDGDLLGINAPSGCLELLIPEGALKQLMTGGKTRSPPLPPVCFLHIEKQSAVPFPASDGANRKENFKIRKLNNGGVF